METVMRMSGWRLAILGCALVSGAAAGETVLAERPIAVVTPIRIEIPLTAITDAEWEKGEFSFYLTAQNRVAGWTLYAKPDVMFVTDGVNRLPLANPPGADHFGGIPSGRPLKLVFPIPPLAREKGIVFENTMGLYRMLAHPDGPYTLRAWKGLRPVVSGYVDRMNRNYIVDATSVGDEGVMFHYTAPGRATVSSRLPSWRGRLAGETEPFEVAVAIDTRDGDRVETRVAVEPRAQTTPAPLPVEDVRVGLCYYRVRDDEGVVRGGLDPAENQVDNVRDFIDADLGNLFVLWSEEPAFTERKFAMLGEMAAKDTAMMTIYKSDRPELLERYRDVMGGRFLENNIGEYAGHLYQDIKSAAMYHIPTDMTDLREARDYFINQFIGARARTEHKNYRWFFSTSGSALGGYELAGGVDFMCSELYAVGANNIHYATAEMRGAARRWRPEYWGGWLAEEWQTQSVPYEVPQKYDLLKVGLYTQYLMGTSVMVLESGAEFTQAHDHTVTPADSEYGGKPSKKRQGYHGHAPTNYRRVMKGFYDFVRANPRAAGTPETRMAVLLGNCDSWVGAYHDWFPAWAQHTTAKTDPNWMYGDPERSWQAAMSVFFPIVPDAVKPFANYWVGGSPYGQVDVVAIDEDLRAGELARYPFVCFAGWNTMAPEVFSALTEYVENGGTLLIAAPHLSTRVDREYRDYTAADLIGGGSLAPLLDATITGRRPVDAALAAKGVPGAPARLSGVSLADVTLGAGVETLASADGRPVLVSAAHGKGRVALLLTWEYPGHARVADLYQSVLRHFGGAVEQSVRIEAAAGRDADRDAINFAAYPGKAYFLNTDCVHARTFTAVVDGRRETLTLQPTEFRILDRK